MKIKNVVMSKGRTGFFFDDQRAIKAGATHEGAFYEGDPITEGFTGIRQAGESISVMLILEDGQIAYGDCAAVQYSGAGGRDPLFLAEVFIDKYEEFLKEKLVGRELDSFRTLAEEMDRTVDHEGKRLHTALRYGISQALLDAVARANNILMVDVVAKEYNTEVSTEPISIFSQSGDDRYNNVDKMIIKESDVMPHALINHVEDKLGAKGEKLLEYVTWMRERIMKWRSREEYAPIFHIDVYGTLGLAFDNDYKAIVDYLETLEKAASPLTLRIEGPVDTGTREGTLEAMRILTEMVNERGMSVELVADEWCNTFEDIVLFAENNAGHMLQIKTPDLGGINNTIEAVLYCKEKGVGAYQGGTCNETDRSARVCVHAAMATRPDQILAKPGMGVDEGYMIVYNEMQRILALKKAGL
ncbi:methylaspartate ammonia-lyase [Vallitalea okinawensis]|uniref:methylaspartate ammonia-lyase n=1 Tax=Vallitalea okinawensis TaxID=2078660 RepID=UPI000CFCFB20|nr:methylaspartate ammonia-lyase [Vallitalea okinawensis]